MNVTLTLDDNLVREIRKIAAEQETTLAAMVRDHLEQVYAQHGNSDRKRRDLERLNQTLDRLQTRLGYGKRNWNREDLYERS